MGEPQYTDGEMESIFAETMGADEATADSIAEAVDMAGLVDYVPEAEPVEAPEESDPVRRAWLARRELGFGASEVAVVLVALGMRSPDLLASYQRPEANAIAVRLGNKRSKAVAVPRIFLRKAGLRRPLKLSAPMLLGIEREPELVRQWRLRLERGTAGPDAALIDPASVRYMPDLGLPELLPLRDLVEPRMLCTPDILCRDVFGELGAIDGKCSFEPYGPKYGAAPPHIVVQVNAQMAICGASWGGVLEGEGWSCTWRDRGGEPWGPPVTYPVARDEGLIADIRTACRVGWERVEELTASARVDLRPASRGESDRGLFEPGYGDEGAYDDGQHDVF